MSSEVLPPAQPAFILRGHSAHVQALHFTSGNTRLLTADADGWVVSWNLSFKRPVAVWKAHANAILGLGSWLQDRIITHGRDNKLAVWQLGPSEEDSMAKTLPIDGPAQPTPQPWLLHVLTVNTLNFCSFAMCYDGLPQPLPNLEGSEEKKPVFPILIAVPNTIDSGGIDIYHLPLESRAAVIHSDRDVTTGMVMALDIQAETTRIQVAVGYESGHTMVFVQSDPGASFQKLYVAQPHSQPILSIAIFPSGDFYATSAADAVVAKHPLPVMKGVWKTELKPVKISHTKHSGQQGLRIRSDEKILATAGWDSRIRVYSGKTLKEVAVLRWHSTGCYATAFANIADHTDEIKYEEMQIKKEFDENDESTIQRSSAVTAVQQRRDQKAQATHWLAAASKDGKVSLWDIY
ncbi:MAG: hypothetical protein Q9190_000891 [Brigantiaea leucoxantha]